MTDSMFVEQLKYCRIGFGNTGELIIGPIMTSQMLLMANWLNRFIIVIADEVRVALTTLKYT